jgi:hypothetical protein
LILAGWKETERLFYLADAYSSRMIEVQSRRGCSSNGSPWNDRVAIPAEVVAPVIVPRVEETNCLAGVRIMNFDPVRLAQVTTRASPSEIVETRLASL